IHIQLATRDPPEELADIDRRRHRLPWLHRLGPLDAPGLLGLGRRAAPRRGATGPADPEDAPLRRHGDPGLTPPADPVALARDRDVEVDGDPAAPEQIRPATVLFVQMGLQDDVVAVLLHPHFTVLEEPLRALLARAAHALACLDPDLAVLADRDLRVSRD